MVTEEEEELSLEKKKNLEILKNLLHIDVDPPKRRKLAAEGQKFRYENYFSRKTKANLYLYKLSLFS